MEEDGKPLPATSPFDKEKDRSAGTASCYFNKIDTHNVHVATAITIIHLLSLLCYAAMTWQNTIKCEAQFSLSFTSVLPCDSMLLKLDRNTSDAVLFLL